MTNKQKELLTLSIIAAIIIVVTTKPTSSFDNLKHGCWSGGYKCTLVYAQSADIGNVESIDILVWCHCITHSSFTNVWRHRQLYEYTINSSIGIQSADIIQQFTFTDWRR